jgi:4-amino-4-deoxy-L-arabinose transferase-like glycosyltransferase
MVSEQMEGKTRWRYGIVVTGLILAGFFARLLYALHARGGDLGTLHFPDERATYLPLARLVLDQGWRFLLTQESLRIGPINPLWIALWHADIRLVKLINITVLSLAGILVWHSCLKLHGRAAALLVLALYSFYTPFMRYGGSLLTEPLFISLLILSFWLFHQSDGSERRSTSRYLFLSGIVFGLATLTRPAIMLFPVLLLVAAPFLWWAVMKIQPQSKQPFSFRPFLIFLLGFGLLVLPYFLKNVVVLKRPTIANGFGAVLYGGTDLKKHGDAPRLSGMRYDVDDVARPYSHLDTEGDRLLARAAIQRIKRYPAAIGALMPAKMFKALLGCGYDYFNPENNVLAFRARASHMEVVARVLELLERTSVTLLGIAGLISATTSLRYRIFALVFALYVVASMTVTLPISRYALPLYPILLVFVPGFVREYSTARPQTRRRRTLAFLWLFAVVAIAAYLAFGGVFSSAMVSRQYLDYFDTQRTVNVEHAASVQDLKQVGNDQWKPTGQHPFLVFAVEPIELQKNQVFFLELRVEPATLFGGRRKVRIFWSADSQFSDASSYTFPLAGNGRLNPYAISPSLSPAWHGLISWVRLDFRDCAPFDACTISRLELAR